MKKGLFTTLALFMCITVFGQRVNIDGINYELNYDYTAGVCSDDNYHWKDNVFIPSRITYEGEQYTVTSIMDGAYQDSHMTYVSLPNTITSIGNWAFYNCSYLIWINIPNSLVDSLIHS